MHEAPGEHEERQTMMLAAAVGSLAQLCSPVLAASV